MGKQITERESNIELLRVLAMCGILVLHYNNPAIGGGIAYVEKGSINAALLYVLEAIADCSVNLFMLISGYFLSTSVKRDGWKVIELILRVVIFSTGIYILRAVISGNFTVYGLMSSMVPANYFVILYSCVFALSPYINRLLDSLSDASYRRLIVMIFILFSMYPTFIDICMEVTGSERIGLSSIGMYGSEYGYTIVNFTMMYMIGCAVKRFQKQLDGLKTIYLIMGIGACIVAIALWSVWNDQTAWEYCNPLLVLEATLLFILFGRLKIGSSKVINGLSRASFSVFLLHGLFITHIGIKRFVKANPFVMFLHICISVVAIYLACWILDFIYTKVKTPVFNCLRKKDLWIVDLSDD